MIQRSVQLITLIFLVGCASSAVLDVKDAENTLKISEFDKVVEVKQIPQKTKPKAQLKAAKPKKKYVSKKKAKPKKEKVEKLTEKKLIKKIKKKVRYPKIEDAAGFEGRRPIEDPFRVGEKVRLKLTYFNIAAGEVELGVKPFVKINNRKSYEFFMTAKSYSFFSNIYKVEDSAETYVDYETLVPSTMAVHVKETKQLREIRLFQDYKKNTAKFWQKKINKDKKVEEKNIEWKIPKYSQNLVSLPFYVRNFKLEPKKTYVVQLADEGKNKIIKAHVLRREKLKTDIGTFDTLVIRPEVEIEGALKPMGDVLFWLTDDDRKFLVRIESQIRIGTIVAKLIDIEPGE